MKYYRVDTQDIKLDHFSNPVLIGPPPPPFETLKEAEDYVAFCKEHDPEASYKIVEISEIE